MVKNKKAFNLTEILFVIAIVGIIVVIMMTQIKPVDNLYKMQYKKAYNVLSLAAYNVYNDAIKQNNVSMYTDNELCKNLAEYINMLTVDNCKGDYISLDGEAFPVESIQFISTNDMIFYMSKAFKLTEKVDAPMYRIIWIDINGKRHPNKAIWNKNKPADIVAFAINDLGEVTPLGYPKIDPRYMTVRAIYPDESHIEKNVTTYLEAQRKAFGLQEYEYESLSYNFDQTSLLFKESVLKILPESISDDVLKQDELCKNKNGADFPKCTIEIAE